MSADKYPSIFSRQMETIVYLLKTVSLDNVIREFSLASPSWSMSHYYTMPCSVNMASICVILGGVFILSLV